MSKRYTDSTKWDKKWIRLLPPSYKLFWLYLLDRCDHAGIWDVDFGLASFQLGVEVDGQEALGAFGDHVKVLDGGDKWFIPKFIDFQYGDLNPENRVHRSVLALLEKHLTIEKGALMPLGRVLKGGQGALPGLLPDESPAQGDTPPPPKKPKKAKKPKAPIPPAVEAYRRCAHRYPPKSWYENILAVVGDEETKLAAWEQTVKAYIGLGWNPGNIVGMLDYFKAGKIPALAVKNKELSPAEAKIRSRAIAWMSQIGTRKSAKEIEDQIDQTIAKYGCASISRALEKQNVVPDPGLKSFWAEVKR